MRHLALLLATLLLIAGTAQATSSYMQQLPTSGQFRCLNCHNVQDPPLASASLNSFGTAFRDNGFRWDRELAQLRSDSDNCTNGFELGDEDGDGRPDPNVTVERSNPGQPDCTLQLTPAAWSALKELFR
jgi:hypothetical protein